MGSSYFDYIIIAAFALSFIALVVAVILFIHYNIPAVIKDLRVNMEKKQVEKIRSKSFASTQRSSAANVFEELEANAKPRRATTRRLRTNTTDDLNASAGKDPTTDKMGQAPFSQTPAANAAGANNAAVLPPADINASANPGTTVLQRAPESDDFVIDKNIVFVSTNALLQ